MNDERRHFKRIPFDHEASLNYSGRIETCQLLDISLKGALVEMDPKDHSQVGTNCLFKIQLSGSQVEIVTHAKLVFKKGLQGGLVFKDMGIDSLTHLRRLVELNTGDTDEVRKELFFIVGSNQE